MAQGVPNVNAHVLHPENWVDVYADQLYGFVCSRVTDAIVAEDIVQETFLSAWKAKDTYKGDASEKNWLYAICKNKVIDYYRKQAREVQNQMSTLADSGMFDAADEWNIAARPQDWSADKNVESKEFYRILELCKNRLQELQQAVFVLKYMDEMESVDICKELNISSSNYWTLMHRAKLQLRGCLEKNWFNY